MSKPSIERLDGAGKRCLEGTFVARKKLAVGFIPDSKDGVENGGSSFNNSTS